MKYRVNENCIGCGSCVSLTDSKVFDFNDEGTAEFIVDTVPTELEEDAKNAKENCPVSAIEEVK